MWHPFNVWGIHHTVEDRPPGKQVLQPAQRSHTLGDTAIQQYLNPNQNESGFMCKM
jgi:hypothetical protein